MLLNVVRETTDSTVDRAPCVETLWCGIETVVDTHENRVNFMGVQVMRQGRSVSRKQHRTFLMGGTSKARSGDVLRFAAEYQEKVEVVR